MTEREKMAAGLWYDANFDKELLEERAKAEQLCWQLSQTPPFPPNLREGLLRKLLPHMGERVTILLPLYVDYGTNCFIGDDCFFNHNTYFMDGAPITFGKNCFIGPSCGFYTASHPLEAEARNRGLERARPITVGDNVWLGANVVVLPGVTIGEGSVIGAGSVVTRDIPAGVLAVGNPCR